MRAFRPAIAEFEPFVLTEDAEINGTKCPKGIWYFYHEADGTPHLYGSFETEEEAREHARQFQKLGDN